LIFRLKEYSSFLFIAGTEVGVTIVGELAVVVVVVFC